MLVIDPKLKDAQIEFRESMKKFDCPNSTRLEIARTSAPGIIRHFPYFPLNSDNLI